MASKQMEEVQKKLAMLNYPRANAPAQSLLFAGMERYALLEWLFFKLLGDKSPFSQQNLQGDAVDRDEETSRIQYLAEIAKFLGITTTIDIEAIQGRGSYEDRTEMLRLIVDLVEASIYADNPEWSVDEQVARDIQLIDAIAEKQAQIFSEECKLFPADVQIQSIYPLPDISDLEKQLSDQSNRLLNLQEMVDDLASKHPYNPDEDYVEVEAKLRAHLESFLETARSFNTIYTKEIRPWTHMMEVPQLHGFGPAANRLLEAYKMLLKFLGNLKNLRDSHAAVAVGSSETVAGEPSSVMRIISECETALTFLNRDLGILSASIAREKGGQASLDFLISPLHNSTVTYWDLINKALQRSRNRADYFASRSFASRMSSTSTMLLMASSGDFLMKLSVGTPPFEFMGILDTGSVLTWTQVRLVIIVTLKSSLFSLPRNRQLTKCCLEIQNSANPLEGGNFIEEASGVIGLGPGPGSLVNQMNSVIGGKFSYCLLSQSHIKNYRSSQIHFGSNSVVSGAGVISTGLHIFRNSYALRFKGISVGKKKLAMTRLSNSSSSSKILGFFNERIIVDSGTVLTHFPKKLYQPLEEAMKKEIKLEQAHAREMLRLCYKTPDGKMRGPIVTVHFVGADVKLYPTNTFLGISEDVHCLGVVPHDGVPIFGNLAQRNFLVGFDLRRKTLSFKQTDCSKQ
ncbi:AUGMIN subunit [Sesamum alatum]|uniref:AUGMIN subunit n=1 Tax=Sesamum alatum TaxID=300844 RepID=A0AAE2CBL9_9LAMI|nr:AUGMIN subunit [Sesamum alatum]